MSESLMEDLASAWDEVTNEEADDAIQQDTESPPAGELSAEDRPQDDPDTAAEPDLVRADQETPAAVDPGAEQSAPALETDTPPKSLSPAAREAWKDVPAPVKAEIAKREQDYERGIMKYASDAKRAAGMDRTLAPFQQFFAMNGGAGQTIPAVLQTASILQMGSPVQKAQMVANLIHQFGVDITSLDSLLAGQQPEVNPVEQLLDSRLAPLQQKLSQYEQREHMQAQQAQHQVMSEVQKFAADPNNEFYKDVRESMADIMDLAANRGREMSLQDAYNQACQLDPQIRQIIAAREAAKSTAGRRNAAVSITGSPGGDGGSAPPESLRGAIEAAWAVDGSRI